MRLLLIAGMLALTGCSAASQALVNEGVEKIKQTKDAEARLAVQTPCAIGIGAYYRVLNETERRAVAALCGGGLERPVTVEDLERITQ